MAKQLLPAISCAAQEMRVFQVGEAVSEIASKQAKIQGYSHQITILHPQTSNLSSLSSHHSQIWFQSRIIQQERLTEESDSLALYRRKF